MRPCTEQRGVTMGCLYLEIEGQPCLVGRVYQGLMKNRQVDLLDPMSQKTARKKNILRVKFSPQRRSLPGTFQQITPEKKLQTFDPNYRLSTAINLRPFFFGEENKKRKKTEVRPRDDGHVCMYVEHGVRNFRVYLSKTAWTVGLSCEKNDEYSVFSFK